ncbi:MAG TPA: dihydrolipoamide acetyltransferase family protein [Bryobacteraceae bacterium]|jgi:pyruvate dehydrogenase E2 component (dihydrolipoamide acetyltransferase)|nr:dihydrolipoamide acetyltransferase family protein [Bryobacteraceae bacterium]
MEVLMPQLGETVTEGKITVWFKSVGDAVAPGDNLFEIETDKTSMEVPATSAGILQEIRVQQGETVLVNAVVAVIGEAVISDGAAPPAPAKRAAVALDVYNEVRTPARNFGPAALPNGVRVSPLARRLAAEGGIDLAQVKGSGPHGRIHAADLKAARPAPTTSSIPVRTLYKDVPFETVPVDAMRRTIARRLVEAKQTIPHFYLVADVDITRLLAIREGAGIALGVKLSVNDFVIKGFALALQRVPAANAVWAEDSILRFKHSDVGVAVSIEGGLFTPVIRKAETKSLATISTEMKDLAARARERKLLPHEYQGGAASVSNLGMHGVREFSAIINPPQSSILAVGAGLRRPVEAPDGSVRFATLMTVTLSCDHRVVDGALGAQLVGAFKAVMEDPAALFA